MSEFNYLKANRAYNELYYQYPKVFIESETYRTLSEGAKIAYMLLKARSEIAIYKNQIDSEGNLYFEFTGKELAEMMNCSERRITAIKKELENFNLLKQVKMGFNKQTGKNEKNRLYLAELEVTDKDIYLMQSREINSETLDNSGLENFTTRSELSKSPQSLDNSGLENSATRSNTDQSRDNSGLENFAKEFNNSPLDTNRHNKDSSKIDQQDQLFLENFVALNLEKAAWVPEIILKLIQTYSRDYQVALETLHTIQKAKHIAEKETRTKIMYEEVPNFVENPDHSLYTTIQKAYLKQKTEKVDNLQSLIFIYVKNWFIEKPIFLKNSLGL